MAIYSVLTWFLLYDYLVFKERILRDCTLKTKQTKNVQPFVRKDNVP